MSNNTVNGKVKLDELLQAMDYVSAGEFLDAEAYVCIETGKVYCHAEEFADVEEPLPDDIEDSEKYLEIPHKRDLDLGKYLVLKFVAENLPDAYEDVQRIFSRPGAYSRAKALFAQRGVLEQWYAFEADSQAEALRDWCEAKGIRCEE